MGKETAKPKSKGTRLTPFRFKPETLDDLDVVMAEYGLTSRAEAVRLLARKEAKKILEKSARSG